MKRIVTHREPDADALVSAWLAERFLFAGEECEVIFVARRSLPENRWNADCVVDIGGVYDVTHLVFDHKPPAFEDRNAHCATELLYAFLRQQQKQVNHLLPLVRVIHEGDSNPPRRGSENLQISRREGVHRQIRQARETASSDAELYILICQWLDAFNQTLLAVA